MHFLDVITPENAENKYVTYTSSDESVISYEKGFSFPNIHKEGTVTVTATTDDGGYSASMKVTVVKGHGTNGFYIQSNAGSGTVVETGNCGENGDNVKYTLYDNGLLHIYGSSKMKDYGYHDSPFFARQTKKVVIDYGVTSIGKFAFYDCSSLTSITIPSSVTSIGDWAFYDCSSLTSINIPDSVTNIGIRSLHGTAWFADKPNGVVYAGKVAYHYKGEMPSRTKLILKEGTKGIADYAFDGCYNLTNIIIPNSVINIGYRAFSWCGLWNVTIQNSDTSIADGAFLGCRGLADSNGLVIVNKVLYYYCGNASNVNIPSGVTSIDVFAFHYYNGFKSVTIPDSVTSIGNYAFSGCSSLTSVNIPSSVTSIGALAFFNCSSLTSVTIPNSVTSIGNSAFYGCSSLMGVTIPNSVTSIGEKALGYSYDYKVGYTIYGKTGSAAQIYAKNNGFNFVVAPDDPTLKNNSEISAATVKLGTAVTLTGKATGGTVPYKYAYYYKKSTDSAWTRAYTTPAGNAYTKNANITFKPTAAGTYNVRINVKDKYGEGEVVSKEFTVRVLSNEALKNSSKVSATIVTAGTEVTLTGNATGGTAPYKYAYYYKKSTDSAWIRAYTTPAGNAYTKNTEITFKPTTTGTYNIRINVKDENGTGTMSTKEFTIKALSSDVLINSSTVSTKTASLDTGVTITAKATGGTAPYKYAYYYKKTSASSWTVLDKVGSSAYSTNATARFKPSDAGTYNLRVNIKDNNGTGTAVTKDFTITVK